MSASENFKCVATGPNGVGDAVGVENSRWYIAIVNNNTEKAVLERLEKLGYEAYVARQEVIRVWKNGRKAKVDQVVIPSMVFIKCTEKERKTIVTLPYINRFMTNKAAATKAGYNKPLAVIPQSQIDTLRFMLGQSDVPVSFIETPFRQYDKVTVLRGNLKGLEGEVLQVNDDKSEIIVRIDMLGSAIMKIDSVNLERI